MFQPRFADAAGSRVRQGEKIDIVDISGCAFDIGHGHGLCAASFTLAGWPSRPSHKDAVNTFLRIRNLRSHRFAAIVLRRNIPLGEVINVGAEGNTAASRGGRRLVLTIGFLAILAAGAAVYWYGVQGPRPAHAARAAARPGVPVSVAIVSRQDVPVYLTGLGTVQASFTVGIHSQVDGKLQEVLFTEGQHVKKGDVLAKIDPRLFQAALDQARAKKAQDQAQLTSAEKDLARSKTLALSNITSQQILPRDTDAPKLFPITICAFS